VVTPVPSMPPIAATIEVPIGRRPQCVYIRGKHPRARDPIVARVGIAPVAGSPYVVITRAWWLAVLGERRRWIRCVYRLPLIIRHVLIGGRGVVSGRRSCCRLSLILRSVYGSQITIGRCIGIWRQLVLHRILILRPGTPCHRQRNGCQKKKEVAEFAHTSLVQAFQGPVCRERLRKSAQIHDVNVGPQADVVRQIPADMVRIVIDYNLIAVPKPIGAKIQIVRGYTPVEVAKPETARASASQSPYVTLSDPTRESSMFKGLIEVIVGIILPRVVPNPLTVCVYVRSFRMSRHVGGRPAARRHGLCFRRFRCSRNCLRLRGSGTARWNVSRTHASSAAFLFSSLGPCRNGHQSDC